MNALTPSSRRVAAFSLAALMGAGAFFWVASDALAQDGTSVICFRGRTMTVPNSYLPRLQPNTPGPCPVTPS